MRSRCSGNPLGAHDLWIAATALRHGMDVATADARDFKRVPGLTVVPIPTAAEQ